MLTTSGLRAVTLTAALIALTGCGTSTDPADPPGATEPAEPQGATAPIEPSASTDHAQPSAAQIHGTAESVDDVGEPDRTPLDDTTLAVMVAADADLLWDAVDFTPDTSQLATVGGLIGADVLDTAQLVTIEDGQFALAIDDGDYLVCLLDGTGPTPCAVALTRPCVDRPPGASAQERAASPLSTNPRTWTRTQELFLGSSPGSRVEPFRG